MSERCVILPPSLTRIFRSLTQRGLISQVDCSDARRHRVMLTETGRALFEAVMEESEPHYQRLAAAFGAERLDSLMNLLSNCATRRNPEREDAAPDIAGTLRKLVRRPLTAPPVLRLARRFRPGFLDRCHHHMG